MARRRCEGPVGPFASASWAAGDEGTDERLGAWLGIATLLPDFAGRSPVAIALSRPCLWAASSRAGAELLLCPAAHSDAALFVAACCEAADLLRVTFASTGAALPFALDACSPKRLHPCQRRISRVVVMTIVTDLS
jgi:hypothetical protein